MPYKQMGSPRQRSGNESGSQGRMGTWDEEVIERCMYHRNSVNVIAFRIVSTPF